MSGWHTLSGLGSALGGFSLLAFSLPVSGAVPASPSAPPAPPNTLEERAGVEPESGPPRVPASDQEVILITGSTGGLGEELAHRLAARGAHVILHGRNVERGMALVRAIEEEGSGSASFHPADLASLDEVRRLASTIRESYPRLDVLINNAGILRTDGRTESVDGYEMVLHVNYLSHFLLTHELLPLLRASAPARIVNVASAAQSPIDFDDVMLERDGAISRAYGQSKLAQILHAFDLAEELEGTGVLVNVLHPATFMDTGMVRDAGVEPRSTVDEGADAVMQLITEPIGSGRYFNGLDATRAHDQAYDREARRKLRELSRQWVGLDEPFDVGSPTSVGLSEDGLNEATALLQAHIDAGDIAGVVAAVVRDGTLVYHEALGHRDLEAGSFMPHDALFRIYSMTRPITALGILMLHDDGRLDVNDPVQRYLPKFASQEVLRDAASMDVSETRRREGDITLAHLLTHTSGVGSRGSTLYRTHGVHSWDQSLEEVVDNVAALPLFEDPGTRYRYGMHSEILGRVIEEVSGLSLQEFFQQRIFGPLGMTDTMFRVDPPRQHRLATVYRPDPEGRLRPHEMESVPVTEERVLTSSGVGLVASTMDLLRFSQFILDGGGTIGGDGGGKPLLRPESVRLIMENAVPEALLPLGGSGYWAGSGWSLGGFAVVLDPSTYGHGVNPGEVWWDGSAGTRFWIDPNENMVTVIQAQISPAGGNGFREGFKSRVHASIVERRSP